MQIGRFRFFEKKSLAAPDADLLSVFNITNPNTYAAGYTTALSVPAVQSAIMLVAGSIASLDLMVQRRQGENWVRDDAHAVSRLLADQPNDFASTHDLIRDVIATALTNDKGGLAFVGRNVAGEVVEVTRYEPAHYTVTWSTDGRQEPSYRINNSPVATRDVIHLRAPLGRCPMSLAADSIGVAKKMENHAGGLFSRGARPGGVIETPKNVGDEGVKKMLAGWRAAHEGADKAGKTAVLWDGAKWVQGTLNSVDAQFLETWKFLILEIARAFRVPPQLLFDFDRATWSNAEQAGKEWLASLEFWMAPLEGALRRALFRADERREYRIRFDRDDLSNVDLVARATAINGLIASRVLNPNEGRAWLDLPPRDGGEVFANPNTGASQPGNPVGGGANAA